MQLSLDPEQELAELHIYVKRDREGKHLQVVVTVANDRGRLLGRVVKRGTKPRQEGGLPDMVRRIVQAYLYGDAGTVEVAAGLGWLQDVPMLSAVGD